ncbi:MAG: TetR/AcrR family transcriptional regulator [Flavipsychrobacter sp.]|nr:TetR/AcrR family transcriptional regulator [Flavipsychrobacter sp.]
MNRKQRIATVALTLFAERGFENTSSQLIAKEAEVAESLIFKHFGNKDKLLDYIIKTGYMRIVEHNRGTLTERNAHELINAALELPLKLITDEPMFWRLQYRLVDMPFSVEQHQRFLKPLYALLKNAFIELDYKNAEEETQFVMLVIDALWKSHITKGLEYVESMSSFVKTKYQF